jgi:RHS repeat-associated protein
MASTYTDPETGYIYLRARYYDPATAQFLTRDPLVAVTASAYGYVDNNPLNGTDPTGLFWGQGFVKHHWRGIAKGLLIAAVVVAVVALPVAGAGLIIAGGVGTAEAASTLALATGLGFAGTALSAGSTAVTCQYGSDAACKWGLATTSGGGGASILGRFSPGWGSIIGAASAIAGLFNPHWNDCLATGSTNGTVNPQKNPDGSNTSGGATPYVDPAGEPIYPPPVYK